MIHIIETICDHFSSVQTSFGRPDPQRTPFASGPPWSELTGPTTFHSPPFMALTLYQAGMQLVRSDYIAAADRYTLYLLSAVRDPLKGRWDAYTDHAAEFIRKQTGTVQTPQMAYLMCRSWMHGIGLDVLCRGFMAAHPGETGLLAKAAALYDWLQEFRIDRGPHFRIGYTPTGLQDASLDGAFTDDLGLVGRGLASYYALSRRRDVLQDLAGLAEYYLRSHRENSDNGSFSDALGTWVICPWPLEIHAEHFSGQARADRTGWGFSNREAVDFLTRLHGWAQNDDLKRRIRDRAVRGMKWGFDACQHDSGAVGMMGRDDGLTGMAGAAVCNFLDCLQAGLLTEEETREYGRKASRAVAWIPSRFGDQWIEQKGYEKITGQVSLNPPENVAWLLAWTAEALLRWMAVAKQFHQV